ncbi:MAG: hypothetical protein ACLQVI_08970 [Polyangiaceae bacterium]
MTSRPATLADRFVIVTNRPVMVTDRFVVVRNALAALVSRGARSAGDVAWGA